MLVRDIAHIVENHQWLSPTTFSVADSIEDTATNNCRDELLKEQDQQKTTDSCEVEVVDQEESPELERFAIAHQLATTKDDGIVDDDEDARLLQCRHRCLAGDESEILGRIAREQLEALAEVGP